MDDRMADSEMIGCIQEHAFLAGVECGKNEILFRLDVIMKNGVLSDGTYADIGKFVLNEIKKIQKEFTKKKVSQHKN